MKQSFDRLSKLYRWLEYVTFARALEHCRYHYLPQLGGIQRALVLGDGDGRFAERLLATAPHAHIVAVDSSRAMLNCLYARCQRSGFAERLTIFQADLTYGLPKQVRRGAYDLVVTNFFLDCITDSAVKHLSRQVASSLTPDARWILAEFHVPATALRVPAQILIRSLYLAFRLLAGLETQRMPDYANALIQAGYTQQQCAYALGGILVAELWTVSTFNQTRRLVMR